MSLQNTLTETTTTINEPSLLLNESITHETNSLLYDFRRSIESFHELSQPYLHQSSSSPLKIKSTIQNQRNFNGPKPGSLNMSTTRDEEISFDVSISTCT